MDMDGIFGKYYELIFLQYIMTVNEDVQRDMNCVNLLLNNAEDDTSLTVWVPSAATSQPTQVSDAVVQNVASSEPNSQVLLCEIIFNLSSHGYLPVI